MKKLWGWLRTLNAGEWIAIVVLFGGSAFVLWLVAANTWSAVVGSLQPEIVKFKGTEYDLIAQRSMSAAAWWMVLITGASTIVGSLGLFLIFRTLQEAKRSADAAEKAVAASGLAIETSREIGQAQVRAHLMIARASFSQRNSVYWGLELVVMNHGQTPAHKVVVRCVLRVDTHNDFNLIKGVPMLRQARSTIDLAPAASTDVIFNIRGVSEALNEARARNEVGGTVVLDTTIFYYDVFNERQEVHARFHGLHSRKGETFVPMRRDVSED